MDTRLQKAFDLASDTAKQLITLAAAVLAVTITLVTFGYAIELLAIVWIAYLISLLAGVWKLNGLTRELARAAAEDDVPSLGTRAVILPSRIQVASFAIGTASLVVYGLLPGS